MRIKTILLLGILAAAGLGLLWYGSYAGNSAPAFRTLDVTRGDLVATVSATGTIEPEEVVDVGAQVVGMIQEFGPDPRDPRKFIDYRSEVEAGTILARIDDSLYRARLNKAEAQVEQSKAQIEQSEADLRRAEADQAQMQAKDVQAARDWERAQKLGPSRAISETDLDTLKAAREVAKANLRVAEAAVAQAKSAKARAEKALTAAQADRDEAQKNLDFTVIRSPVKGVIIDRRVNVGQTVVSSMNAPSLFLIAKDLKRVQIWASVNEADISRIHPGQPVRFTVDAHSGEVFRGEVIQIRLNASMTQNVVTYPVVVSTDNSNGKLFPYMTANLKFEIDRRSNVLRVPNAALRWRPRLDAVVPDVRADYNRRERDANAEGAKESQAGAEPRQDRGVVWVRENSFVRPVEVQTGLSNGLFTEIVGGDLKEGQAVVVGEASAEAEDAASPFAPRFFGKR